MFNLLNATDEQIEKTENFDELVQKQAIQIIQDYDASRYHWSDNPTDDQCKLCYEWRRFPIGQRHFGYAWWRICSYDCLCDHHKSEIWMA